MRVPAEPADGHAVMRGMALAQGDRQRHLVEGYGRPAVVEGPVARAPLLPGHLARLLEALPQQRPGSVVEEDEHAAGVDEQRRRREARRQVASEDELEGLLLSGRVHMSTLPTRLRVEDEAAPIKVS